MKRLALILLIFVGTSWGAISRTGSCQANTTSCTLTASTSGDLEVAFAYRSASTTSPTPPVGWTTVQAFATGNGGTTGAWTIACQKSTGSTSSGTWTGSPSSIGVVSYAGTAVNATADCSFTGIGHVSTNTGKTSTAANFAATAITGNLNTWFVGLMGSTTAPCTPTGMTGVTTPGTAPTVKISDTNTTHAAWGSTNCTISSGTWGAAVVELIFPSAAAPVISPSTNNYTSVQTVTITGSTTICFTTNGSTPAMNSSGTCSAGTTYTGGFSVGSNSVPSFNNKVIAITGSTTLNASSLATNAYSFGLPHATAFGMGPGATLAAPAIDTTNAILIVAVCGSSTPFEPNSEGATDTAGNTYVFHTGESTTNAAIGLLEKTSPLNSASNVVTCGNYSGSSAQHHFMSVIAFQSPYFTGPVVYDQLCADSSIFLGAATTLATCSPALTPTLVNEILVVGAQSEINQVASSIDSGFTLGNNVVGDGTQVNMWGDAWLVDSANTAINPIWTWPASGLSSTVMYAFKPFVASSCSNFISLLGAGCQ